MPDFQKLQETKRKIIEFLNSNGPSLPPRIAKEAGVSTLFVSAFLAELVSEKRLKISNMKVGSSPIYYSEGQKEKLENFIEHLKSKEKEAFLSLKNSKILEDEKQLPAIRVALRKIKDFAIATQVKIDGKTTLFWRFFQTSPEETKNLIENTLMNNLENNSVVSPKKEIIEEKPVQEKETNELVKKIPEKKEEQIPNETQRLETQEISNPIEKEKVTEENLGIFDEEKIKTLTANSFKDTVKKYLENKEIQIIEEISSKKKEFISKVRISTIFGNQDFYLISKEKKKINENDLTIALQKAQTEKMPALIISPGELDKKAKIHIKEWENLIKFQQLQQ